MRKFAKKFFVLLAFISVGFFISCNKEDDSTSPPEPQTQTPTPVQPHTITAIAPETGPAGTEVTITGTGFNTTVANNTVKFNGLNAVVNSATATQIKAVVPANAGQGAVSVTIGETAVTGPVFNYFEPHSIGDITPTSGKKGTSVIISGTGFNTDKAKNIVSFNGVEAVVNSATANVLVVEVPLKAVDGAITITIDDVTISGPEFDYIETYTVSSFAGFGTHGFADGTGQNAMFHWPLNGVIDANDNIFVADYGNRRIRKVTPSGVVTTFAGTGVTGSTDGPLTVATFSMTAGVSFDANGNYYVSDYGNSRIRKISSAGVVSTLAGSTSGFADGTGAEAQFNMPQMNAVDASGNIFVADYANRCIRKITPAGVVTTFAGLGNTPGNVDGTGTAARFSGPSGLIIDSEGNLYVADNVNNNIRKITSQGVVTTIAGNGEIGTTDGTGTEARFNRPSGIALDADGNLFVTEKGNHRIRKVTPSGVVTTVAGTNQGFLNGDGTESKFNSPAGVVIDSQGSLFIIEENNHRIRKITVE